jgi:hypothetical protein
LVIKALDPYWIRIRIGLQHQTLDPDPEKMYTDPQPWFFHADPDMDPAFYLNADPNPECQTNADPAPAPGRKLKSQKDEFLHEKYTKYQVICTNRIQIQFQDSQMKRSTSPKQYYCLTSTVGATTPDRSKNNYSVTPM